jgi:hypothetical protein
MGSEQSVKGTDGMGRHNTGKGLGQEHLRHWVRGKAGQRPTTSLSWL